MLQILNPVTPTAPIKENKNPPTIAPTIPRMMSRRIPSPALLTILLAMKPAIRPRTIQPMMDILSSLVTTLFSEELSDLACHWSDLGGPDRACRIYDLSSAIWCLCEIVTEQW